MSMLNKEQKKEVVEALTQELRQAKGVVLSSFERLVTKDSQALRGELKREGVKHKVVKLTLLKRALRQAGVNPGEFDMKVPVAVSWSQDDEVMPAKLLQTFAKTHEHLKILAGVLDKQMIDALAVKQLAALPGKQDLRAQVVGVIASPLRGLVSVLAGNLRGLLNVLNAIKTTKA